MNELTLGSLFSGSGTFEMAGILSGITPVWASEIEPFPIAVTRKRLPFMKHYDDISKLNGAELPPVDIITFGSPCTDLSVAGKRAGIHAERSGLFFEAIRVIKEMRNKTDGEFPKYIVWENVCFTEDTLITCESGYKKIKDVSVGERVKTHTGKYMPVVKVHQNKKQQLLKLKVSGSEDIFVTPKHPFLAVKKIYSGKRVCGITSPEWIPANELTNKHLIGYRIDEPTLPENFITETEAWAVGRWIADGSVDLKKSNPRMFFSIGVGKETDARVHLGMLPYAIYENKPHPTATNFCFTSHEFYSLISEAGVGAGNKRIPPYVFQLPFRLQKAVLEGYLSGDGYIRKRGNHTELSASTASRELAYGISRLIRNVYRVAANISVCSAKSGQINGREIHANYPCYSISASITNTVTTSVASENIIWQPVKSIEAVKEKKTVYNLSVLEDNTYAANDIIVHNCGAFSSGGGEDFRCVLEEICKIADESAVIPKPAKWSNAGEILGGHYSVAYRLFDAQYWGVPQRRKRIYLVADFTGERAGKILFESEGVSGYSAEGFRAWQRAAGGAADCVGEAGFASLGEVCKSPYHLAFAGKFCLCDQGGNRMDVTEDMTCTLRAEAHHPPCVLSAGFCTEHSAKARGIGYEEEKSPTLRAGVVPAAMTCYENHSQDTRYRGPLDVAPTVSATYGMGGNNQPFVVNAPIPFSKGTRPHSKDECETWKDGKVANTLNTYDVGEIRANELVVQAFGISAFESNSMKSANPHSGVYEADTSRTLDCGGGTPACNQGGIAIVESYALQGSMIGRADKNGPQGDGINEDMSFCLNTVDKHAVVYAIDRETFNCGQNFARNMGISENGVSSTLNAQGPSAVATPVFTSSKASFFTNAQADTANTLVATDYKDPPLINDVGYTVRRLTPQECALLQGMPTWWCQDIGIENPTEEDMAFWHDVFETHRLAVSPEKKPKTDKQILKWLKNPHSDSAEYRMWGNGLAACNAFFVLAGIAYYAKQ